MGRARVRNVLHFSVWRPAATPELTGPEER